MREYSPALIALLKGIVYSQQKNGMGKCIAISVGDQKICCRYGA